MYTHTRPSQCSQAKDITFLLLSRLLYLTIHPHPPPTVCILRFHISHSSSFHSVQSVVTMVTVSTVNTCASPCHGHYCTLYHTTTGLSHDFQLSSPLSHTALTKAAINQLKRQLFNYREFCFITLD